MSKKEFARLDILRELESGGLTVADACVVLGLSRRQVFRLLADYRAEGAASLVSRRRGRPSNNRLPDDVRSLAVSLVQQHYADFGPKLAAEKLSERHGCRVSRETLRHWMMAEGLWLNRRDRRQKVYQPRHRRDCVGELIQVDGCEHWWFEGRGPQCTLLVFIDDATSWLMHLKFVPSESAFAYFQAMREYLERHGKPIALYSDKHSVFRPTGAGDAERGIMTQFGCAGAQDAAGSLGQGAAAGPDRQPRSGKRLHGGLHRRLQRPLCQASPDRQGPAPARVGSR